MNEMKLTIEGMHCGGCVRRVEAGLRKLPGTTVDKVEVGKASLHYDPDKVTSVQILHAVSDLGFQATIINAHHA